MKRQIGLLAILILVNMTARAKDVFFIGHSLVNFDMPRMVQGLAEDAGFTHTSSAQINNGSTLKYNWDNSATAQGFDARAVLPAGGHEVVVMTERVPLGQAMKYNDTYTYASNFYNLAVNSNAKTDVFLYETWACVNSGTSAGCSYDSEDDMEWRGRLDFERSRWEGIADAVNAQSSGAVQMRIVPGGQAMGELYDEIAAGRVPGVSHIKDVFEDDIHLNDYGMYFIALVQYATIYGKSPVGLTTSLDTKWGQPYQTPSAATAQKMQQIAWDVVCNYSRTGVSCEGSPEPVAPRAPSNLSAVVQGQ
jgi:hypothetical protein